MFDDNPTSFDLTTMARDLPRPHDRVYGYGMSVDKNKPPALCISADQFFAETLRIASNLAGELQGRSANTSQFYLRYAKFLAQQRYTYTDDSILLFDEEFRTSATEEDFNIDNRDQLERISHKYFQSHAVRRTAPRFVPYNPRTRPSSSLKSDFPKRCLHPLQPGSWLWKVHMSIRPQVWILWRYQPSSFQVRQTQTTVIAFLHQPKR